MTLSDSTVAFRILEVVSILFPLVLVFLRVSIQYYRDESVESRPVEQGVILLSIGFAGAILISAGTNAVDILTQKSYSPIITNTLSLVRSAMFLLVLPLSFIVFGALTDLAREADLSISTPAFFNQNRSQTEQESNTPGTDEHSKEAEEATDE